MERQCRHRRLKGIGAHGHAGAHRKLLDDRHEAGGLVLDRDRRTAARRHGADVEQVESFLGERHAVGDRPLGRLAARTLEEGVVGDIDDPHGERGAEVEDFVGEPPARHRHLS